MPRFRQVTQIQELMGNKEAIRNIGIIAHIDHGKTTLADSLLAGAGMLSPSMAGTARVLDYLEEEQKRKITIKTANISLLYKTLAGNYIINLVDTPGHVDFTGKVTRALRAIDGAVVVVDAVEEIMAQTEIVTRQALEERVRPVLFINKVDRLITELQLNAEMIQKKLDHLISRFNDLIEVYGEAPYKDQWKISPRAGNVAFGAALHGWGFTLDIAKQKSVKFQDIINAYQQHNYEPFKKTLPVHKAIFEMTTKILPNPRVAQAYRVETIWDGHVDSTVGRALAECRDEGTAVMCVTNVAAVQGGGCLATGRVFSGKLQKGCQVHLVDASVEAEVGGVYVDMGSFQEEVSEISAGNLGTVSLPVMLKAGETLVDSAFKEGMTPFESVNYVSEPVMTIAVEPKNPQQISELLVALEKLASEDPNLHVTTDRVTGEYLLSGMGELHLEIATNQLKRDFGLEVEASAPRVVYMETVSSRGIVACAKSPNKQNSFSIQVEPEPEGKKMASEEMGKLLYFDENGNAFMDCSGKTEGVSGAVLESLIGGFEYACKAGPLCGEPTRFVKVKLVDMQLSLNQESPTEVMHGVGKAIFASFLTAKPVLLEPVYATTVSVSSELAGECSRILTTRRGKIKNFEQKGLLTAIKGFIPVAETFGFSKEIRSATSGRAVWQSIFDHWEKILERLAQQTIAELRKRKGLAAEVPKPEKFME
ncbi:MAG: GTP-binding protein [Candidatus Bathyarchaeia archaeon]